MHTGSIVNGATVRCTPQAAPQPDQHETLFFWGLGGGGTWPRGCPSLTERVQSEMEERHHF